ncbi:tRNA (adenosine(37)-N6)-dimethylallyltransferase MiaA [Candidatus Beckwithbacteria bacterium]|nr:tRNA (adenosine(37)-N6)-dimethylallyltransferase MiaA [Candidatus Beckwithbacteria bacterium]
MRKILHKHKKVLIISGPTAVGKSKLAFDLAKKYNGELISADSRQVYQGMDIVTGKDLPTDSRQKIGGLDLARPDQEFDVSHFVTFAQKTIANILEREKLPIIVGGTGFYLKNLLDPAQTIGVPINRKLRKKLDQLSVDKLQKRLQKSNKNKWQQMNNSDRNNPRRLIRAIEISNSKVQDYNSKLVTNSKLPNYDLLWIGLKTNKEKLEQNIKKRVKERIKQGAEDEVKKLLKQGYSWDLPSMSAIGYRDFRPYIEGKQNLEETIRLWTLHELQYAKRQMTFFTYQKFFDKKQLGGQAKIKEIKWFDVTQKDWLDQIEQEMRKWLNNSCKQ